MGAITKLIPGVGQVEAGLDAIGFAARHKLLIGGLAVSGVLGLGGGAAVAYGQHLNYVGLEATADLNKANTSSDASLLKYDDANQMLDVATAYIDERFTATKVPYIVNSKPIDVVPDAEINKELQGTAANQYKIPLSALHWSLNPQTGKHDIVVDGTKAEVLAFWPGAGPKVRQFTVNKDGKGKNFGDRSGFRDSLIHFVGAGGKLVNLDTLTNTMDDLDSKIDHDIKLKALETLTESCAPQLQTRNEAAIKKAVANLLPATERQKLGEITISNLQFKYDVVPADVAKGSKYPSNINTFEIKNFTVDEYKCDATAPAGVHD